MQHGVGRDYADRVDSREIEAFVNAARNGTPVPVSGEEGTKAVRAVQMLEDSLAEG